MREVIRNLQNKHTKKTPVTPRLFFGISRRAQICLLNINFLLRFFFFSSHSCLLWLLAGANYSPFVKQECCRVFKLILCVFFFFFLTYDSPSQSPSIFPSGLAATVSLSVLRMRSAFRKLIPKSRAYIINLALLINSGTLRARFVYLRKIAQKQAFQFLQRPPLLFFVRTNILKLSAAFIFPDQSDNKKPIGYRIIYILWERGKLNQCARLLHD